jgi:hypothetical protein
MQQQLKPFEKLAARASPIAGHLLRQISGTLFPILKAGGFDVSPAYIHMSKNAFGSIWGINQIPFQDRTVDSWPTVMIHVDRDLSPNFRVELCTIPTMPRMLTNDLLPRDEANCSHSMRCLYLTKGKSSSYLDQQFGAGVMACFKRHRIERDVKLCASLLSRITAISDRRNFLESVEAAVGKAHIYESWNASTPDRPNHSS